MPFMREEVDDQSVVAGSETGAVVSAAADSRQQVVVRPYFTAAMTSATSRNAR